MMGFKTNPIIHIIPVMVLSLNSCSIVDPASPLASYIRIDSISLNTDPVTQGSNSKKITDAWVLVDRKYLGTFPLPCIIPVLGEGNHSVTVRAGILQNGITESRAAYPKYTSYDTMFNTITGDTTTLQPVVQYADGLNFVQIEDFDDASLSLVTTNVDYASLSITGMSDPNSYEGNSGIVTLDTSHAIFESASSFTFTLPLNVPAYMELNYKSDVDFLVGAFITTTGGIQKVDLLAIRATTVWKKIYVTLSELGAVNSQSIEEKIFIRAELGNLTTANLYLDNLKVIY